MTSHDLRSISFKTVAVLFFGMAAAIYFGLQAGFGNYPLLATITGVVVCLSLLGTVHRLLLPICLAVACLDFWAAPTGFKTAAIEQTGFLVAGIWLAIVWRKEVLAGPKSAFQELMSYKVFRSCVLIMCFYAGVQFFYNKYEPYEILAFGWQGALKTYTQVFGPFLMIVVMAETKLIRSKPELCRKLLAVFFYVILLIFCLRLSAVLRVGLIADTDVVSIQEKYASYRSFYIPGLNVWDNHYTLRVLGPLGALIGSTFLFTSKKGTGRLLPLLVMGLGLAGCLISGGRAAILFGLLFVLAAAMYARRREIVVAAGTLCLIVYGTILLIPASAFMDTPYYFQRSIAMIKPDLKTAAAGSIQGSSEMRKDLFSFAWDYWSNGDARLLFTGRSVSSMDEQDVLSFELSNEATTRFFGIRRLATHSGLTDMLIGFGAVGYLLSLITWIACFNMMVQYQKCFERGSLGANWIFIGKMGLAFWIIYMHFGGSWVWASVIWLVIVGLAQTEGLLFTPNQQKAKPARIPARPMGGNRPPMKPIGV